jgi:hypothetical protein
MQQYLQLFLKGIEKKTDRTGGRCFVAAFTSPQTGEGVSYTAQSFAVELAQRGGKRTLIADVRRLARVNMVYQSAVSRHCFRTNVPNLWTLPAEDESEAAEDFQNDKRQLQRYGINSELELSQSNLRTLRSAFDYILLDCPAMSVSDEAALLASETDGVMVVVEADGTKREQILNVKEAIEAADGKLLGFVLNKRQYLVPNWIYNKL